MRRTARIVQRTAVLLTIVLLAGCTPVDGAGEPSACGTEAIAVGAGAAELQRALDAARPGDALQLAGTTYTGTFTISVSGDAAHPITLCGARGTRLDGGTVDRGNVLHLDGASHWVLDGFAVTRGAKGIVLDRSSDTRLRNLDVSDIGQEGIHLRTASSRNTITTTTVRDTGLTDPTFGEGVYVGSAQSNWCTYTACEPDASDDNTIEDSTIEGTRAEAIDVKEGTTGTLIRDNTLGIASDAAVDSVVDLKGNDALFDGNHVRAERITGVQVHVILPGWGARNIITGNTFALGDGDTPPAIELAGAARSAGNVVSCSNVTASGTTVTMNVTCAG